MSFRRFVVRASLAASTLLIVLVVAPSIDAQDPPTVQDGVFTGAQAARGRALYAERCAGCHGPALAGAQAPPLEGASFRGKWRQEPLSALFIKIRYTMPPEASGAGPLSSEEGADLVAHILAANGFPAGTAAFAAADATTSRIGWPAAPAGEQPPMAAAPYAPSGTLNQLMRGVFFHNSNLIFSVQELQAADLPPRPETSKPDLTVFEWGLHVYTGWPAVENAALALADASTLMLRPGLLCSNGRPAPVTEPDWIRFTDQMIAVARRTYRLAQAKDQEAVAAFTTDLSAACAACHNVYRDVGGRGRGRGGNTVAGLTAGRCTHR